MKSNASLLFLLFILSTFSCFGQYNELAANVQSSFRADIQHSEELYYAQKYEESRVHFAKLCDDYQDEYSCNMERELIKKLNKECDCGLNYQYERIIEYADKFYDACDCSKAKELYNRAASFKINDPHVRQRLLELKDNC